MVAERGEEGIAQVLELTGGDGTHVVVEAVGLRPAYDMAVGVVRVGGVISRIGVPQYEEAPVGFASLFGKNVTLTGGPAPVRAYIEELLPEVLDGRLQPGRVFDRAVSLDDVPAGYRAGDGRPRVDQGAGEPVSTWSQEDLGLLGGAGEVEVSSVRRDGSLSRARTVWIVRVGDELYLRSVNGPDAAWYRSTRSRHQGRIEARGVARDVTWIRRRRHRTASRRAGRRRGIRPQVPGLHVSHRAHHQPASAHHNHESRSPMTSRATSITGSAQADHHAAAVVTSARQLIQRSQKWT